MDYIRKPEYDRRIERDGCDGDAWFNAETGEVEWFATEYDPNADWTPKQFETWVKQRAWPLVHLCSAMRDPDFDRSEWTAEERDRAIANPERFRAKIRHLMALVEREENETVRAMLEGLALD